MVGPLFSSLGRNSLNRMSCCGPFVFFFFLDGNRVVDLTMKIYIIQPSLIIAGPFSFLEF